MRDAFSLHPARAPAAASAGVWNDADGNAIAHTTKGNKDQISVRDMLSAIGLRDPPRFMPRESGAGVRCAAVAVEAIGAAAV